MFNTSLKSLIGNPLIIMQVNRGQSHSFLCFCILRLLCSNKIPYFFISRGKFKFAHFQEKSSQSVKMLFFFFAPCQKKKTASEFVLVSPCKLCPRRKKKKKMSSSFFPACFFFSAIFLKSSQLVGHKLFRGKKNTLPLAELKTKNLSKRQLCCCLVEFLVFNSIHQKKRTRLKL